MYQMPEDSTLHKASRKRWIKRWVIGGIAAVLIGIGGVIAIEENSPPCSCINPALLNPPTPTNQPVPFDDPEASDSPIVVL